MKTENRLMLDYLKTIVCLTPEERQKQLKILMEEEKLTLVDLTSILKVAKSTVYGWIHIEKAKASKKLAVETAYERKKAFNFMCNIKETLTYVTHNKEIKLKPIDKEKIKLLIMRLNILISK